MTDALTDYSMQVGCNEANCRLSSRISHIRLAVIDGKQRLIIDFLTTDGDTLPLSFPIPSALLLQRASRRRSCSEH